MKCKTEGCLRERMSEGNAYCARCAVYAASPSEPISGSNTKSEPMGEFSTMGPGAQSHNALSDELSSEIGDESDTPKIQRSEKKSQGKKENGIVKKETPKKERGGRVYYHMKNGAIMKSDKRMLNLTQDDSKSNEHGTEQIEKSISKLSTEDETGATLPENLTEQLMMPEQAELVSLSLANDVLNRLHLQIKRLTLSPQEKVIAIDTREGMKKANEACKTASEISKMIKLKIYAYRTFKGL